MKLLEFGTHRSVVITPDNRRLVIRHNPPLTKDQFCEAYLQVKAGNLIAADIAGLAHQPAPAAPPMPPTPQPPTPPATQRLLDPDTARNVLDDPLLHDASPGGTGRNVGIRVCTGNTGTGSSLGQFTDYHGERRTLPRLNGHTIRGILLQPTALDPAVTPDDAALRAIATAASQYRRKQGIGAPEAGPEATELYIRIFRALGVTAAMLQNLDAKRLVELYKAYLVVHASA